LETVICSFLDGIQPGGKEALRKRAFTSYRYRTFDFPGNSLTSKLTLEITHKYGWETNSVMILQHCSTSNIEQGTILKTGTDLKGEELAMRKEQENDRAF